MIKSFFDIKESGKENICPDCGGKLIDDFCDACNNYDSPEASRKRLKEKVPHIICENERLVDEDRDNNKTIASVKNGFIIFLIIVFFALVITAGTISENKHTDFKADIPIDDYSEIGSDAEIAIKLNHPRYLDDVKIAKNVWKHEIDKNKVVINGQDNSIHNRNNIIEIDVTKYGLWKNYISYVEIYFSRFDEIVSFGDALSIVSTYLPKETIEQYYTEDLSYSASRDYGKGTLYSKTYILKDDKYSNEPTLEPYFEIIIRVDENGNAQQAIIDSYALAEFDDETMVKWDYDFFSATEKITTTKATTDKTTTAESGRIVYITPYGEKYHYSAGCAGKNAMEQDYDDVEGLYDPCKKCAY